MALRTVKINLGTTAGSAATYSDQTKYNTLAAPTVGNLRYSGLKDVDGVSVPVALTFSAKVRNYYSQAGIASGTYFGIPSSVWTTNWSWDNAVYPTSTLTIEGVNPGKTVSIEFGSTAFSNLNKISFTIGENKVVYPNTIGSSSIEEPVTITGVADSQGVLTITMSDDNGDSNYDLAFLNITYSDGVGEEPYPVFSEKMVLDKFDTIFQDTTENLDVFVLDETTGNLVLKGTTNVLPTGEFRYGDEVLSPMTDYWVGIVSSSRNWFGLLRTGV